jgi:D-lyxose ketol-isomerase
MLCSRCNKYDDYQYSVDDYLYTKDNKPMCPHCVKLFLFDNQVAHDKKKKELYDEKVRAKREKQKNCDHVFSDLDEYEKMCDKCRLIDFI